jgi:hypothetical protein
MFSQDIIDRFWSKVDKTSDPHGHWLWTGGASLHNGYGRFSFIYEKKRYNFQAHRFAYILMHGHIPEGLLVLHKPPCVTRLCVLHTYLGTQSDNWTDTLSLGREASGKKNGTHTHPERVARGERVNHAQLTTQDIVHIRQARHSVTQDELAQKYGVHKATISKVQLGKTWQHVPGHVAPAPISNQGEQHGNAKLSEDEVLAIRKAYTGKRGDMTRLGNLYGVKTHTIRQIVLRITWTHI